MSTPAASLPAESAPRQLPPFVAAVASRLPQLVPSAVLAAALEIGLKRRVGRDALQGLERKAVRIVVRDAGLTMTVRCRDARFYPGFAAARADVTIGASLADFVLLALREEDPDTLFFARRLTMEGDTEAGLIVKNLLDSADLSPIAIWLARARSLADLRVRLSRVGRQRGGAATEPMFARGKPRRDS